MAIIVFQHSDIGEPGRLGITLRDHGFKLDIRRLDIDPIRIPPDYDDVHGVISLGGPQNPDDDGIAHDPWLQAEINYLRGAHERELPVVGVCLGAELIALALGGAVTRMNRPEYGFAPLHINPAGQVETILAGIAWEHPQLHLHSCHVSTLPRDATLLASTDACKVQAFKAGIRTYAFQFHFECDRPMIEAYGRRCAVELSECGFAPGEFTQQIDQHYARYARHSDRLCLNIATCLFPLERRLTA